MIENVPSAWVDLRKRLVDERGIPRSADDRAAPSSLCQCVDCRCDSLRSITYPVVCLQCRLGAHASPER